MSKSKKQKVPRERNQFVAAALFRLAGAHRKSNKAIRQQENRKAQKEGYDPFLINMWC